MSKIAILGVPIDYSAFGHGEGCDQGPQAIRDQGLLSGLQKHQVDFEDMGDLTMPPAGKVENNRLKFVTEITAANKDLYDKTTQILADGRLPIVLGGDHSGVIGSIKAVNDFYNDDIGVLWLDAHLDCNTEATTTSGNIHGMVVPQLTGDGAPELVSLGKNTIPHERFAFVGIRNPDPPELDYVDKNTIFMRDIWDIQEQGIANVLQEAIDYLKTKSKKLYLSFDLDVIDALFAPGVGTPTHGGLTYRETIFVSRKLRKLFQDGTLVGMDIVELNPQLDKDNATAHIAVEYIMSILGYEYGPFVRFRDQRPPLDA